MKRPSEASFNPIAAATRGKNDDSEPQLETKHLKWIIDWSLEACVEQIENTEREIMRHQLFAQEPLCDKYPGLKQTRGDRIESLRGFLTQYRECHKFLAAAKEQVVDKMNDEFVAAMKAMFRARREGGR